MGLFNFTKQKETGNGVISGIPQDIYQKGTLELKDVLAPSALQITPKELLLGEQVARSFFVISYPRYLSEHWFAPVINLDKIFDISIFIHPIDTAPMLKKLQKKIAEVQSQINDREDKGMVRDPMLDTAYQDIEALRDALQQAEQKLFDVGVYISMYASSKDELDKVENEIKSILEAQMVYVKPALFQQEQGYRSTLPLSQDELLVHNKINSETLASIFPFISFDLTTERGILYGVNRHNNSLILFDRYSMENYNSVLFAKSGAGKSYATKLEVLRSLMFDTEVIVIDPEREYEYMASATGGRYFNISLTSEHHINPFDLPVIREDESPSEILRQNIITLTGLFKILLGGLSPEEEAIIDRAINETYALKEITPDIDFTHMTPPLLSDFELVLGGMEGSDSLMKRISKYTQGTWAGFINKPTNVDINQKFVVFSVRDMEEELKPAAMYLITNHIWTSVRRTLKKRLMVVDEAWWMMKSEDTARFLYSVAKRGRKYYLGLATITQDVDDFLKNEYGVPILQNSSIQILLKQSPTAMKRLQEVFELTDQEKYLLLESQVGEGMFFAGNKHVAVQIIASYTEDQIITSDPSQLLAIQKEKDALREMQQQV
jgi:conjugal transfer ATP-binding protein TraC